MKCKKVIFWPYFAHTSSFDTVQLQTLHHQNSLRVCIWSSMMKLDVWSNVAPVVQFYYAQRLENLSFLFTHIFCCQWPSSLSHKVPYNCKIPLKIFQKLTNISYISLFWGRGWISWWYDDMKVYFLLFKVNSFWLLERVALLNNRNMQNVKTFLYVTEMQATSFLHLL